MKSVEEQLKDEGDRTRIAFSHERHARLVASLENAGSRQQDVNLEGVSNFRRVAIVGAIGIAAGLGLFLIQRQPTADRASQHFGAPMYLAERSIERVQTVADGFPDSATDPLLTPTTDAVRFLADQLSLARSLAPASPRKLPA